MKNTALKSKISGFRLTLAALCFSNDTQEMARVYTNFVNNLSQVELIKISKLKIFKDLKPFLRNDIANNILKQTSKT